MSKVEILSVNHIDLRIIKCLSGNPLYVRIKASGWVKSSGWKNPELIYTDLNEEGFYTFALVAEPPSDERFPISKEVCVELVWPMPEDFIGIEVITQENTLAEIVKESKIRLLLLCGFGFIIFLFCFFILNGVL